MRVFVYRNLHKNCWSVKSLDTGRVITRQDRVYLSDVTMKVSIKGRDKVRKEQCKNVHAGVVGTVCHFPPNGHCKQAYYNPYKCDMFEVNHPVRRYKKRGQLCWDCKFADLNINSKTPVLVWF